MANHTDDISFSDLFTTLTPKKGIFFIIALGVAVFFNALFGEFVWDDLSYIQFNPDVHTINLFTLFSENSFNQSFGQYRALTATYFAVLYTFFADATFFYHVIQLMLHITNTIILYKLFQRFFSVSLSFFLSVIFLIHPMQVESVSFIGAAGNILFFFFGSSALLLFHHSHYRQRYLYLCGGFLLLLCSLLTKETGIIFLFLVTFASILFHWKKNILFFICGTVVLSAYLLFRFLPANTPTPTDTLASIIPISHLPIWERLGNIPAIFFYYLQTFFFPWTLAINQTWVITGYDVRQFFFPLFILGVFFLFFVVFARYLWRKHKTTFPHFLFFTLWFFIGIGIHMQLIPLDMTVADRWFYAPMAGLLGMIGVLFTVFPLRRYQHVVSILAICLIFGFSLRTMIRNTNWTDNMTLFSHDATVMDNFEIENNLASFYSLQRNPKEAVIHAKKSVRLFPYETNMNTLAFIYENLGEYTKAKQYYTQSITSPVRSPNYHKRAAFAYLRWGGVELFHGDPKKAIAIYETAVKKYPDDGVLWSFLAAAYHSTGQKEPALSAAKKAEILLPTESTKRVNLFIREGKPFDIRKL